MVREMRRRRSCHCCRALLICARGSSESKGRGAEVRRPLFVVHREDRGISLRLPNCICSHPEVVNSGTTSDRETASETLRL